MQPVDCPFESEVLAAVMEGRWPEATDDRLRDHASGCFICSDTVLVAGEIDNARREARVDVIVPDSTRIWWGAQLRARREDLQTASRPITAAQSIAGACAAGLLGACFGATSAWFQSALKWAGAGAGGIDVTDLIARHGALAAGVGAVLFLIPAAAWLALRRE
ncbi:MAG: hypothetical protein KGN84_05420 [Acidobacteriota bacterium]|nr:hypothetical protein [Acidobacteriota bacterium]